MNNETSKLKRPSILAPAGNKASFLAAIAAGADEIYCGLKQFSARMKAKNFSIEDLAPLTQLAHDKGVKVYVTLNSLLKPDDLDMAGGLLQQLNRHVKPNGIIVQDPPLSSWPGRPAFQAKSICRPCLMSVFQKPLNWRETTLVSTGSFCPESLTSTRSKPWPWPAPRI